MFLGSPGARKLAEGRLRSNEEAMMRGLPLPPRPMLLAEAKSDETSKRRLRVPGLTRSGPMASRID